MVGLLHPGEMGAAVGAVLRGRGHRVVWASEGRSAETRARAEAAALEDVGSVSKVAEADVIRLKFIPVRSGGPFRAPASWGSD